MFAEQLGDMVSKISVELFLLLLARENFAGKQAIRSHQTAHHRAFGRWLVIE